MSELSRAARTYQREVDVLDQALAEYLRVNRTDLRCLDLLVERPRGARELADAAGLSPSATTTALDRLEQAGYVRRDRGEHDRRKLQVQVTPRLLELVAEALGDFAAEADAEAGRYSGAEVDLLVGFLREGTDRRARHAARIRELVRR
jgi:DNA-binding MarR family transcriptional regulator